MRERLNIKQEIKGQNKPESSVIPESKIRKLMKNLVFIAAIGLAPLNESKGDTVTNTAVISAIAQTEQMDLARKKEINTKLDYLKSHFNQEIVNDLLYANDNFKRETSPNHRVLFHGFTEIGIEDKEMAALWQQLYYPKGTFENVNAIVYAGDAGRWKTLKYLNSNKFEAAAQSKQYKHIIEFFFSNEMKRAKSKEEVLRKMDIIFSEELGHMNDWFANKSLTLSERVEFLFEVANHLYSPGSFRDEMGFIDSIDSFSIQDRDFSKVAEFWGGLCRYYLNTPFWLKDKYPKDFELVEKWFKRGDNEFDPSVARSERWGIIHRFASLEEKDHVQAEKDIGMIPKIIKK